MKSKILTMEEAPARESVVKEIEAEPAQPRVIFYRKQQLKKDISFHKKMIWITVLSVLAVAAFYLMV